MAGLTGGDGLRGDGLLAGASGERVAVGRDRVVVLRRVGDDEHSRVGSVSLHLFPGQTTL